MPDENSVMQATVPSAEVDSSLDAFMANQPDSPSPATAAQPAATAAAKPAEAQKAAPVAKLNAETEADRDIDLSGAIDDDSEAKIETPAPVVAEPDLKTPKQLREAYGKTKGELETLRKELETERAKAKSQQSPEEIASLKEQIAALSETRKKIEAERDSHAKELARVSFRESPEFKQKFIEPWQKAQEAAVEELGQFTKETADGKTVPVDWNDIRPLVGMTIPEATVRAKELFGDNFMMAMEHRRVIQRHEKEARTALEQHETLRKQADLDNSETLASAQRSYESEVGRLSKEYPDIYTPATDNPRETEQFNKGSELADAVLLGKTKFNKESGPKAVAIVRQRAAMFPVVAIRLKGAMNELSQLKAELETLKNGGPGGGVSGVTTATASTDELGDSMDQFKAAHKSRY